MLQSMVGIVGVDVFCILYIAIHLTPYLLFMQVGRKMFMGNINLCGYQSCTAGARFIHRKRKLPSTLCPHCLFLNCM